MGLYGSGYVWNVHFRLTLQSKDRWVTGSNARFRYVLHTQVGTWVLILAALFRLLKSFYLPSSVQLSRTHLSLASLSITTFWIPVNTIWIEPGRESLSSAYTLHTFVLRATNPIFREAAAPVVVGRIRRVGLNVVRIISSRAGGASYFASLWHNAISLHKFRVNVLALIEPSVSQRIFALVLYDQTTVIFTR